MPIPKGADKLTYIQQAQDVLVKRYVFFKDLHEYTLLKDCLHELELREIAARDMREHRLKIRTLGDQVRAEKRADPTFVVGPVKD